MGSSIIQSATLFFLNVSLCASAFAYFLELCKQNSPRTFLSTNARNGNKSRGKMHSLAKVTARFRTLNAGACERENVLTVENVKKVAGPKYQRHIWHLQYLYLQKLVVL